jgi:hypothetical protein
MTFEEKKALAEKLAMEHVRRFDALSLLTVQSAMPVIRGNDVDAAAAALLELTDECYKTGFAAGMHCFTMAFFPKKAN